MNVNDYLIQQAGLDWSKILVSCHWIFPREFTLWMVNRFGDLFIVVEDGSVLMLDVGVGTLERVASSREEFCEKIDEPGQAENWLMVPLVDSLVAAGGKLGPGECYSYLQLPAFGGDYTLENTTIKPIATHFAALGPLHEKTKDLPDGTAFTFRIVPRRRIWCPRPSAGGAAKTAPPADAL